VSEVGHGPRSDQTTETRERERKGDADGDMAWRR
jgi:hypothetical protein